MKDTNPKDAVGVRKVPISTLPCGPLLYAGLAMLEGARKYGRHNYRATGVRASVYYDAVVGRHLMPWYEGEDMDPDSGLCHIDKAIAGLLVLRDSMLSGNWVDDRPIRNRVDLAALNEKAAEIIDKYPDAVPPYTQAALEADAVPPGKLRVHTGLAATKPTCGECITLPRCSAHMNIKSNSPACKDFTPVSEPKP